MGPHERRDRRDDAQRQRQREESIEGWSCESRPPAEVHEVPVPVAYFPRVPKKGRKMLLMRQNGASLPCVQRIPTGCGGCQCQGPRQERAQSPGQQCGAPRQRRAAVAQQRASAPEQAVPGSQVHTSQPARGQGMRSMWEESDLSIVPRGGIKSQPGRRSTDPRPQPTNEGGESQPGGPREVQQMPEESGDRGGGLRGRTRIRRG